MQLSVPANTEEHNQHKRLPGVRLSQLGVSRCQFVQARTHRDRRAGKDSIGIGEQSH